MSRNAPTRAKAGIALLVCGGRDFTDRDKAFSTLDRFAAEHGPVAVVIHGAAAGADTIAGEWAAERNITEIRVPADWDANGKAAGPIRNAAMLSMCAPDAVLAFPGGAGTDDMRQKAKSAKVPCFRVS